jgi:hypothetical protein
MRSAQLRSEHTLGELLLKLTHHTRTIEQALRVLALRLGQQLVDQLIGERTL